MAELTHYRKAFDSPYLSSADITDKEGVELTILRVSLEADHTKRTQDKFNTAYFVEKEIRKGEKLKPMILNATNSRMMKQITGSAYIEEWRNVPVLIYVNDNVRFGRETVSGLVVAPKKRKQELMPSNQAAWANAKAAYIRDGNLDKVLARVDISPINQEKLMAEVSAERVSAVKEENVTEENAREAE